MKLTGQVEFRDLEGGVWVLVGDDGRIYQLAGGDRHLKKDGGRIEAEGEVDGGAMTAQMSGPVFRVKRYQFL